MQTFISEFRSNSDVIFVASIKDEGENERLLIFEDIVNIKGETVTGTKFFW